MDAADRRAKYNTLTPAEARKLTRFMSCRQQQQLHLPMRTASVLHKPKTPSVYGASVTVARRPAPAASSPEPRTLNAELSKSKTLSRQSLTSSTTKVFHNQLSNLKKLFNYIPSSKRAAPETNESQAQTHQLPHDQYRQQHNTPRQRPMSAAGAQLDDSLSRLSLNRSLSPVLCPPPPRELKSMSYMESAVNYSNYDEFTRARNHKTSTLMNSYGSRQDHDQVSCADTTLDTSSSTMCARDDVDSWQLTSLPVAYERNLTTVLEERRFSGAYFGKSDLSDRNFVRPPAIFDDNHESSYQNLSGHQRASNMSNMKQQQATSTSNSSQSLSSNATADSVLDYHRQTATSFRFSYAQPRAYEQKKLPEHSNGPNGTNNSSASSSAGLPPKMPSIEGKSTNMNSLSSSTTLVTNGFPNNNINNNNNINKNQKQVSPADSASFGSSSLCGTDVTGHSPSTATISSHIGGDSDGDTTVLFDTSTLHGSEKANLGLANNLTHIDKCDELARTVESLKNMLIAKEKELTDMQLKQWSSDYLIDQLKATIGKLEKDNATLRNMLAHAKRFYVQC